MVVPVSKMSAIVAMALGLVACTQVSAFLAGEQPPGSPAAALTEEGIDGVTEWRGQQSGAQGRAFLVARSEPEWQTLWERVGSPPPGPLPTDRMALAIFLGARNTGGYDVMIEDVRTERRIGERDVLVVGYRERRPAPGARVSQALTSPYAVKLVERSPLPVRYQRLD